MGDTVHLCCSRVSSKYIDVSDVLPVSKFNLNVIKLVKTKGNSKETC